jgi:solute:Na+ symporter, SSS family
MTGTLGLLDWSIIAVYLAGTMAAGLAMRRYVGKVEHFLVAGREMDVSLGIASLAATEFGIVTAMYTSELGYKNGFAGAIPGVLLAIAIAVVGWTGFVIQPLRASGALTIPELLERRFGPRVRLLAGVVMVLGGLLNMGIFLRVGGEFLTIVTGMPMRYLEVTMTALLLMVLVYTVLGGMLSVLVTDYLQFLVLGGGVVLITILVAADAGWEKVVAVVAAERGDGAFNPFTSPGMGPAYVLWQAFSMLAVVLTWQTYIQRVLSAKDPQTAQRMYTRTSIFFVGRYLIPAYWGMAALAMLGAGTESLSPIHAMPAYLARLLPGGLLGLVVAAMLAAEMSTDSSYMLSWGSILYNDVIQPLRKRPFSEKAGLLVNRVIILCIGLFLLVYGLWYEIPGRAWDYLAITSNIYLSSISVLLVACCYWKGANKTGAIAAIVGGAASPIAFLVSGLARNVEVAGLASFGLAACGMFAGSWAGRMRKAG